MEAGYNLLQPISAPSLFTDQQHSSTSPPVQSTTSILSSREKDVIISFLLCLAEDRSEKMPEKEEVHVPFKKRSL